MTTPYARYHIGDRVYCRIDEAGQPPHFEATIIGIRCGTKGEQADYTVAEDGGFMCDGYTEDWLTLIPPTPPHESDANTMGR